MTHPSKIILVFCDGTSMDGVLGLEHVPPESHAKPVSNVLRLSRMVSQFKANGKDPKIPQIIFYQSGVGSQAGFDKSDVTTIASLINGELGERYDQALGHYVASKIREAYMFIAQNYVDGDTICLIGFSRGAYTARKVAGMIDRIGILKGAELYKFSDKLLHPDHHEKHTEVKVKFVGVWDTVGSVRTITGKVLDAYGIPDASLPGNVEHAYHAVSLQENRSHFLPTLWDEIKQPNSKKQVLEQVWFLGDHSDIGGGHQNVDLSDISLFWMADKLKQFVDLEEETLKYFINRPRTAGYGQSQPNNAYLSLPRFLRVLSFTTATRDHLWVGRKDVLVHESCIFAADPIKRPYAMLQVKELLNRVQSVKWTKTSVGSLERRLSESPTWKHPDPTLVKQPDTSEDKVAEDWDRTRKAGREVLSGNIVGGGVKVAGGMVGTGLDLGREIMSGLLKKK